MGEAMRSNGYVGDSPLKPSLSTLTRWSVPLLFFLPHGCPWLSSPCQRGWRQLEKDLDEFISFLSWSGGRWGRQSWARPLLPTHWAPGSFCEQSCSSLHEPWETCSENLKHYCLCLSSANGNVVCIWVSNRLEVLSNIKIVPTFPASSRAQSLKHNWLLIYVAKPIDKYFPHVIYIWWAFNNLLKSLITYFKKSLASHFFGPMEPYASFLNYL